MGVFITFEGPEGSGKTTQVKLLADHLRAAGTRVLTTHEPGGTSIGDQIRTVLLDASNTEMLAETEILLFSAARAQLVAQVIRPSLANGITVLSDRYADSTIAYQGYGRGLDLDALQQITLFATGGLVPNLTIYLDLPVQEGLNRKQRASAREGGAWDRLDQETIAFHQRVREGYLTLATAEPERWIIIDACSSVEKIQVEIQRAIDRVWS